MIQSSGVYIIAEAGVNHNGSLDIAKKLIDVAVEAGIDAVKFQTFKADKIVTQIAPKAEYQKKTTNNTETQLDMLKKLELDEEDHRQLIEYCRYKGIDFLSTPFDVGSLELLAIKFDLPMLKISSGEINNALLLLKAAMTGKSIILSTGMSTIGEIESALAVLAFGYIRSNVRPSMKAFQEAYFTEKGQQILKEKIFLLHCTTEYPAPFGDVNLKTIDTLRVAFNLPVGLSDHTPGIAVPIAAVARGAKIIEKHFTLDKKLPGPDHKASLEPNVLKEMVESIRQVEKSLGGSVKIPAQSELKNKDIARKSIVASCQIRKGEYFTEDNLTVKRPGNGIAPIYYWDLLGKISNKDYTKDEVIVI